MKPPALALMPIGLVIGILSGLLLTHSYPQSGTRQIKGEPILREIVWVTKDGRQCAELYPWEGRQYVSVDALFAPHGYFAITEDEAKRRIEWWCRP